MNELLIVNLDTPNSSGLRPQMEYLSVQFLPQKVDYNPDSQFTAIASPGRNNPFYHYAGSEDTLEFTIDWFSLEFNFAYVINRVRWLESLTKADSYIRRPPRIRLVWGTRDRLWKNCVWIMVSAQYELNSFWIDDYEYREESKPDRLFPGGPGNPNTQNASLQTQQVANRNQTGPRSKRWVDNMPAAATQKIILKRLTDHNLNWLEISKRMDLEPMEYLTPIQPFQIVV